MARTLGDRAQRLRPFDLRAPVVRSWGGVDQMETQKQVGRMEN